MQAIQETSPYCPFIINVHDQLLISWTGEDRRLNIGNWESMKLN